jgi:4-hydroxy-tetrahydrodipicolinate reductase
MSARLRALAQRDDRFKLLELLGLREVEPLSGAPSPTDAIDVLVDFTTPEGTREAIKKIENWRCALLVGTTGLSKPCRDELHALAASHAVMICPNTSLGAAVLDHVTAIAAAALAHRVEVDVVERHHIGKRDAPSGTARRLAETVGRARGASLADDRVHAIRAGDIVGDHEVHFAGAGETLSIRHVVTDRDVFVHGALEAAIWLARQGPGVHHLDQMLGLTPTAALTTS